MVTKDEIKARLKKVKDEGEYTPAEVTKLGVILDAKMKPSIWTLYRLIEAGQIAATNLGIGTKKYRINGKVLKDFVKARHGIK